MRKLLLALALAVAGVRAEAAAFGVTCAADQVTVLCPQTIGLGTTNYWTANNGFTKPLVDVSSEPSVDLNDRLLYRTGSILSVNWQQGYLYDTDAQIVVDWETAGYLYDTNQVLSVDWANRLLVNSSNNNVLEWATNGVKVSTDLTLNQSATTYSLGTFDAFFNSTRNMKITSDQVDASAGGFSIAIAPDISIFPRNVSASSATSKDFSNGTELDFVGCDPTQDTDCLNLATGGMSQQAFYNTSAAFAPGQGAGLNRASVFATSVFAAPGHQPLYQVWMTSDTINGPSFYPIDISTGATVLNLATPQSFLELAPTGGVVRTGGETRVGGGTNSVYYCSGSTAGTFDGNLARGNGNAGACAGGTWVATSLKVD